MCGRYSLNATPQALADLFQLDGLPEVVPRYNIAPSQEVLAIRCTPLSGKREPGLLRWGLIPPWAKSAKPGYGMINARAETLADKPAFRNAFRCRRCLVPATGFYEWLAAPGGKRPFYIRLKKCVPFAFAGLWERWPGDGTTGPVDSCTIITTQANELVRPLHERMPVILDSKLFERWLSPECSAHEELGTMLTPYRSDKMEAFPVGPRVNNPRSDDSTLIEPLCQVD